MIEFIDKDIFLPPPILPKIYQWYEHSVVEDINRQFSYNDIQSYIKYNE